MKVSEITTTLRQIGVSPVKTLGQNFLHDRNLARWIVEQAQITPGDYIVEIGPGLGALTRHVLAKDVSVLAIEKDARLVKFLRTNFPDPHLGILHADALKFDTRVLYPRAPVKLLGNLPYYISSQLLLRFATYPSPISLILLMLQKEMAKRLSATPSTKDYGALTLQVQLHFRVHYLRTVSAAVFLPRPDVDSALVRLTPRAPDELPDCDDEVFRRFVRTGFAQRRKQLGKLLGREVSDWNAAAASIGFDAKARAEDLSLEQWIALANYVAPGASSNAQMSGTEPLTVVDRTDKPVGTATRAEVHANNLLHRAVHVLIFNKKGEVYLQKRSRSKDRHPLRWDSSAAGHVGAGEEYENTARRELMEELGIQAPLTMLAKLPASEGTDFEFICLYRGSSEAGLRPNPSEIEAGEFFPPTVIDEWTANRPQDFAPAFLECWKVLLRLSD